MPTVVLSAQPTGSGCVAHEWPLVLLDMFPPLALISPTMSRLRQWSHSMGFAHEWFQLKTTGLS